MASLSELSEQYRSSGLACKCRLKQLRLRLEGEELSTAQEIRLRRDITLLAAMTRECIETSQYLRRYFERRQELEGRGNNI